MTRDFPAINREAGSVLRLNHTPVPDPAYWYLHEIAEIVQQREPLGANFLDPGRPTCSINAGGEARHDKKPAYFAANTLAPYDQCLQHEREEAGRPADRSGEAHRKWNESVRCALDSRRVHLRHVWDGSFYGKGQSVANARERKAALM